MPAKLDPTMQSKVVSVVIRPNQITDLAVLRDVMGESEAEIIRQALRVGLITILAELKPPVAQPAEWDRLLEIEKLATTGWLSNPAAKRVY